MTAFLSYMRNAFKSMSARLWRNEDKKIPKWPKCKETHFLISAAQSRRNLATECTECEFV